MCWCAQSWLTLCNPMDCSTPDFPVHHQLPKLAQNHVHWLSDAIQPSHPLSSPSPPAFNLSQNQSWKRLERESVLCIRWSKYWRFSFSISPSNEYLGLIFFRIDWFDILAVQGTLKSLFQHHSSKASIKSLGLVHWDDPEGGYGEGGGRRVQDGEHSIPVADSFRYLAKLIQYCKV